MKLTRLIPAVAVTAACAVSAVPAASAATSNIQQASSQNWSGYLIGGGGGSQTSFSGVSGSWVQPTAECTGARRYAAFWVGLGGSGASGSGQSGALEQAGTQADCSSTGAASYFAWYELVPAAPVRVNLAVHPGDHISSRVGVTGNTVTVLLSNQTTGQSAGRTLAMNNPDTSSAEWIAEAPSSCDQAGNCQPLPLTDFGTATFSGASATSNGHTGTISDPAWSAAAVQLGGAGAGPSQFSSADVSSGATPSSLSSDGSSFSVAYSAAAGQTSTGASGYGYGGGGYGPGASGGYGYGPGSYGSYGSYGSDGSDGSGSGYGGYGYGGDGYAYVTPY